MIELTNFLHLQALISGPCALKLGCSHYGPDANGSRRRTSWPLFTKWYVIGWNEMFLITLFQIKGYAKFSSTPSYMTHN